MAAEPIQPERNEEQLTRMSFGDHLDELRRRLVISLITIAVAVFGLMPFKTEITGIYVAPYRDMWNRAFENHCEQVEQKVVDAGGVENLHPAERDTVEFLRQYEDEILSGEYPNVRHIEVRGNFLMPYALKATSGLEDFWIFMAATLLFALICASPIVLWQLWAFIAAGLYKKERNIVMRYFPFAAILLMAGVAFGYFLAVPFGLYFLIQMMNWFQVEPMLRVADYFRFLLTLTAALGVVFQLPLLMLAVVKVGLVSHQTLKKNWRYVILGFFAISAILTPPDPFTQVLMATPMLLLFLLGLFLTSRVAKQQSGPRGAAP